MVEYKDFSIERMPDNEAAYFRMLESVISSVEDAYYLSITKTPDSYKVRISLEDPEYVNSLVSQVNNLNNAMKIIVSWGKSIKAANIFFSIPTK